MQSLLLHEHGAYLCYHDLPGAEPARVFIHGLGSASSAEFVWTAAHPLLRENRSILVDPPGFGYSDRPRRFVIPWRSMRSARPGSSTTCS